MHYTKLLRKNGQWGGKRGGILYLNKIYDTGFGVYTPQDQRSRRIIIYYRLPYQLLTTRPPNRHYGILPTAVRAKLQIGTVVSFEEDSIDYNDYND